MEINQRFATQVGAALSVLLVAAVVVALRIDFGDLGPAIRVRVYLKHPGPLRASADVQLAGRKIGRVDSVRLVTANQARDSSHPLHPAGGVVLAVRVRKKYLPWVRQNSELFVNSRGLIGESYLEVSPPPASQEMQRSLREGDRVRGIDPARMEEIIVTSFLNAKRFGALLDELRPSMTQLKGDLSELSATLDALEPGDSAIPLRPALARAQTEFQSLRTMLASSAEGNLPSARALHSQGRRLANHARTEFAAASSALEQLNERLHAVQDRIPSDLVTRFELASSRAKESLARLERTAAKVEQLSEQVARGMGTVGALMNDKEFADDAKKLGRYIKRHPWEFLTRPLN